MVGVKDGAAVLHNNCFLGNNEAIAPVVIEESSIIADTNFVQRMSDLPPSGCAFVSQVTAGESIYATTNFTDTNFTCVDSDAPVCGVSARSKHVDTPCLKSVNVIAEKEAAVVHDEFTRTYILCPNSTFAVNVGLALEKSNVRILCGPDGASSNDCVLKGGSIQVSIVPHKSAVVDGRIHGLTFSGAAVANVFMSTTSPSHFWLEDCVFRVRSVPYTLRKQS